MRWGYDGSIRIDTAIDVAPVDVGLNEIEEKIDDMATAISLAFGTKELIEFGKRSIDAASDLAEAQNVVDTAFGAMSWKMEQFAATALETYGISELTAKNMGSTYMAMAKGMGMTTDAASDMAVTLTGRLSDIMSFYNKTQSEVDTIGRALITGETEPLKAIGVVMTQTNLSAYAMAQGFAKTYDEMSSNEQLLVRYKYFLEQTSLAQDDFAKTSEGWANQTRLLDERLNQFMTNLGSVIMNVLTPALQFANEAVTFLNELFFGGNSNAEDTTAVKNVEAISDEVTAVGTAADKSKKKLNNLIAGFDELHIISGAGSDKDKQDTTDAGIDTSNLLGVNLDADTSTAKKAAQKYRDIINEIYLAFKQHPLTKVIERIIGDIGKFFGFIKGNEDIDAKIIVNTLMDILGAIIAYKTLKTVVGGISAFSGSFGSLIGLITAHPVVAAVAGITALTIGIIALSNEMERQRIASYFGDISISLEEINQLVSPITENVDKVAGAFEDNKTKLTTAKENFSNIAKAVQETADSFKNNNIEQDVEGFAKQLDDFINGAQELNSATYDTSALETLFASDGEIDDEEQKILDRFNEFGGTVADKIEKIRSEIQQITQTAIDESRNLLESELKNIQKLYDEIAKMTAQQEEVKTSAAWERLKNGAYSYDSYAELAEQIKAAQEQAEKSRQETEKAAYENIMSKAANMLANGVAESEIEAMKEKAFKEISESMEKLETESKRYERDIILSWVEGAAGRLLEAAEIDTPEQLEKVKEMLETILAMPAGVNVDDFLNQFSIGNSLPTYNILRSQILKPMNDMGLDLVSVLEQLNNDIGDSAYSIDEFKEKYAKMIEDFASFETDDIMPTLEEFEGDLDLYSEVLSKWAEMQKFNISLGVEFDSNAEEWDKFLAGERAKYQSPFPTPSSYAPQIPVGKDGKLDISISFDVENANVDNVKTNTVLRGTSFWGNPDLTVNNGK